jgi:hypothetical protein
MIEVKRLADATFPTPDLQKELDYWTYVRRRRSPK